MKKSILSIVLLLITVCVFSQNRRTPFTIVVPWDTDTLKTIPAYSISGYSIYLDFSPADAYDMTADVGTSMEADDGKFVGLASLSSTLPSTLDLTNWPDTMFVAEKPYMPHKHVKLKLTPGTVTPGTVLRGEVQYTK